MSETFDDRVSHSENPTRFIKRRVADLAPTLEADDDRTPANNFASFNVKPSLLTSAAAGGFAGVVVDVTLFPLDTIKTRLQSQYGFRESGGFKGMYKGVIPVLLSSAPISALFFVTYNSIVNALRTDNSSLYPLVYVVAATCAEVVGSSLRVPLEVIKQRRQISNTSSRCIIKKTLRKEGFLGFYRGFWSTLMREIPFAAIQYPLWELMINQFIIYQHGKPLTAFQTACCGALAGAAAAALTTPMDVVKTRIMLAEKEKMDALGHFPNWNIGKEVYHERGVRGLFAGAVPRILWIMFGGFIYFGAYEKVKLLCEGNEKRLAEKERVEPSSPSDTALSYLEDFQQNLASKKKPFCDPNEQEFCLTEEEKEESEEITPERQNIIDTTLLKPSLESTKEDFGV